ncbi:helix-turn-helix transcriptional regulator [Limisphaera sp. 4302-co]|uniref:helix-turn-helix transcriptional regulator n=1 Tax=Limisphaera sp. 4302-co TaxID=3400417 RepID=UPI003C26BEBA
MRARLAEAGERWLELGLRYGFCVEGMAGELRVSERTLEGWFEREGMGMLRDWLGKERMVVARRWSKDGGRVGEVAGRLGYGSVSAFCRAYRRRWGRSPGEERERAR